MCMVLIFSWSYVLDSMVLIVESFFPLSWFSFVFDEIFLVSVYMIQIAEGNEFFLFLLFGTVRFLCLLYLF